MNPVRAIQTLFFLLLICCGQANAGGLVTAVSPADYGRMDDYNMQDYMEPSSARDPFTISDKMHRFAGAQGASGGGQQFVPFMTTGALPKMRVRGFVANGPDNSMALLQIDGEDTVHLIREGDEIGLQHRGNGQPNSVLKVLNIEPGKVEVQTGGLRQVIIVQ